MAYVGNIPYNPATDPKALFAQGIQNYMGGLNQRLDSRRFGKALSEVDPEATLMQIISQMLTGGATSQQAMGVGSMMSRNTVSPSQQLNQLDYNYLMELPPNERNQLIREKMTKPMVSIGGQPWQGGFVGQDAMAARAEKEHRDRMGLSSTQLSNARKGLKTIVREMGHGTGLGDMKGFKNFKRDNLIAAYEQYRVENDYESKSPENKAKLDDIFDSQMETYNKAGYFDHGKNEFDWDPKDDRVVELRKEKADATKEQSAHRLLYDAWDNFPRELQNAIRLAEQNGRTYEEIIQSDEVAEILNKVVK